MKKNLILIFAILVISSMSYGQDEITRVDGKTIDCEIISIDSTIINFSIYRNKTLLKSYVYLADVSSYTWNKKQYLLHELDSAKVVSQKDALIEKYTFGNFTSLDFGVGGSNLMPEILGQDFDLGLRICFKFNFTLPNKLFILSPSFMIKSYRDQVEFDSELTRGITIINPGLRFSCRLIDFDNDKLKLHGFMEANYSEIYDNYTWETTTPYSVNGDNTTTESFSIYKGKTYSTLLGARFQSSVIYFELSYDFLSADVTLSNEMKELLDSEGVDYNSTFTQSFNSINFMVGVNVPFSKMKGAKNPHYFMPSF